ncbi:TMEM165/GDT1 family protein [Sphingomonas montana]|uniref:TMEM165/GDT1 family protein n=1 Tax=Sphingomonas montana TaxID=1843236 RepID=UPI00096F50E0|nr:TMEM165/GDT1 family protein [Sphingomonas montana]
MDALLSAFVACGLAEIGDRSQLLVILLCMRFPGRQGRVLAAAGLAALVSTGIGAAGGAVVHDMVPFRALSLMAALALLSAGIGSLARPKTPKLTVSPRLGAFAGSLAVLLAAGIGDKTQFLTFALSARSASPVLAAIGATLGVLAAAVPAAMLGRRFVHVVPLRAVRIGIGVVLILAGLGFGLDALRLI